MVVISLHAYYASVHAQDHVKSTRTDKEIKKSECVCICFLPSEI